MNFCTQSCTKGSQSTSIKYWLSYGHPLLLPTSYCCRKNGDKSLSSVEIPTFWQSKFLVHTAVRCWPLAVYTEVPEGIIQWHFPYTQYSEGEIFLLGLAQILLAVDVHLTNVRIPKQFEIMDRYNSTNCEESIFFSRKCRSSSNVFYSIFQKTQNSSSIHTLPTKPNKPNNPHKIPTNPYKHLKHLILT